ncbi:unnamed protein product [Camellia sinensis]
MARVCAKGVDFGFRICLLLITFCTIISVSARSDQDIRERFYGNLSLNSTAPNAGDASIAKMFDRVLEKEFSENDQPEGSDGSSFNNSVADQQAVLETVAKITHEKGKKNETQEANGTRSFQFHDVFSLENEGSDDMTTLVDKQDNVFVMSNKKSKYPVLQVDLRLISDLVVVIVSAAIGGIIFSCLGQPVIVGYLLAGSLIGPGGLKFISEMVQSRDSCSVWCCLPSICFRTGVFSDKGLMSSASDIVISQLPYMVLRLITCHMLQLKVVGPVAILGGLLQIAILVCLCGITAMLCGAKLSDGVFVGFFLSMSSTAVVVKFLVERNSNNALHGQVTIGTLIFQDCAVGLLFALLPATGLVHISLCCVCIDLVVHSSISKADDTAIISATNELYQLASVAFCLLSAWCSDKLGLSLELGSFVAGVMISTTDFAQHTLDQEGGERVLEVQAVEILTVEPIRNLFAALFLSSIGMLIHVQFLWTHVDILLASVILVIVVKTTVAAMVTKAFGYSTRTSFLVGVLLAQIGEFSFVLLSRASNLHLVEGKMYILLLGTTALSLVTTPVLFKLIPAMMHLGALMHWFPAENSTQNEGCLKRTASTHTFTKGEKMKKRNCIEDRFKKPDTRKKADIFIMGVFGVASNKEKASMIEANRLL